MNIDAIELLQGRIDNIKQRIQANDAVMKVNDEHNIEMKKENDKLVELLANLEASINALKGEVK